MRGWFRLGPTQILILFVVLSFFLLRYLVDLPVQPVIETDSPSYLDGSEIRPPGYSLFLDLYRFIIGDLSYLPHAQLVLVAGSTLLLSLAVGWRVNNVMVAGVTFVVSFFIRPYEIFENIPSVMSDPLYETLLVSATAFLVWYFSLRKVWLLAVASAFLGMALITRSIAYAVIPVFAICMMILYWQSHSGRKSAIILAATLPLVLCYAAGASSNLHRHGHFRIGSYAGMSLLGRGVVLAQPLSENSSFKSADWIAEAVLPVRNALAQIQHPILKALVVRQYYDNLRWFVLLDQFEERLPGWREASHYEQGRLAGFLASAYIRNDFCGYSELFALDYLSLWVVPRILTTNEHEFLERTYRTLDPLPFLAEFEKTDLGAIQYYKVVPPAKLRRLVLGVRAVNIMFLICSIALISMLFRRASRDRLLGHRLDAVFLIACVHTSYLATALVEGGFERYTSPTWPLMIAAIVLVLHAAAQSRKIPPS